MDIEAFLEAKPPWAYEPALYIVKQSPQLDSNAFRCGASGTQLSKGSDLVYGADRVGQLRGLLGRMVMYKNYWLPNKGTIYAALRVRQQLVARPDQRIGESQGQLFNITRGNQTLVLAREAEFHAELDRRGLRWQQDRNNELFQPRKGVDELIAGLRQIRGEEMYLFDKTSIRQDSAYRGGRALDILRETQPRLLPTRVAAAQARAPTITVRLSKEAIQQLQSADPKKFALLLDIVDAVNKSGRPHTPQTPQVITMSRRDVEALRGNGTQEERARAATNLEREVELPTGATTRAQARAHELANRRITRAMARNNPVM